MQPKYNTTTIMSSYLSTDVDHVSVRVIERQENAAAGIHLFYF